MCKQVGGGALNEIAGEYSKRKIIFSNGHAGCDHTWELVEEVLPCFRVVCLPVLKLKTWQKQKSG